MTEITRVPLAPIAKGALTKLWLGVAAAALAAGGVVWASLPPGVDVEVIKAGTGRFATKDDVVWIKYVGKLAANGKEFQRTPENPFQLPAGFPKGVLPDGIYMEVSGAIPGFAEGLLKVQKGGTYTLEIPAEKAYGANPPEGSDIPPNSDLVFEIEVMDIKTPQEQQALLQAASAAASKLQEAEAKKSGKKPASDLPPGMPDPAEMQGAPLPQ